MPITDFAKGKEKFTEIHGELVASFYERVYGPDIFNPASIENWYFHGGSPQDFTISVLQPKVVDYAMKNAPLVIENLLSVRGGSIHTPQMFARVATLSYIMDHSRVNLAHRYYPDRDFPAEFIYAAPVDGKGVRLQKVVSALRTLHKNPKGVSGSMDDKDARVLRNILEQFDKKNS